MPAQNYQPLFFMIPMYGVGFPCLIFLPYPFNLWGFAIGMSVTFGVMGGTPTAAKVIARGYKQIWFQVESRSKIWKWPTGRNQFWYKQSQHSKYDEVAQEWHTEVPLAKPYRHPAHNNRKPVWLLFLKHGWYSCLDSDEGLTADDKRNIGTFEQLFPKAGGWVNYLTYLVYIPTSDWCILQEVMPSKQELEWVKDGAEKKATVLNHNPIMKNGIAYALFKVKRTNGSLAVEDSWRSRRSQMLGDGQAQIEQTEDILALKCAACGAALPAPQSETDVLKCGYCGVSNMVKPLVAKA